MVVIDAIIANLSVWEVRSQIDESILNIDTEKNAHNETALIVACRFKNLSWVDFLLSLGSDSSALSKDNQNAIQLLIDKDTPLYSISMLIEMGADANHQDRDEQPVLFYALKYNRDDITHLLLTEGAEADIVDKDGNSSLLFAALCGNARCVEVLIEAGAKIDQNNKRGQTALHLAALSGSLEAVKILIESGVPANHKDLLGRSALHYSAIQENADITEVLVKAGVNIHGADQEGLNALMLASLQGIPSQVEALLRLGANCEAVDKKFESSVIKALKQEPVAIFHLLAAEKTDVDPQVKIKGITSDLSFIDEVIKVTGQKDAKDNSDIIRIHGKYQDYGQGENTIVKGSGKSPTDDYAKVTEILLSSEIPFDLKEEIKKNPSLFEKIKKNEAMLRAVMAYVKRKKEAPSKASLPPGLPDSDIDRKLKAVGPMKVEKKEKAPEAELPSNVSDLPLNAKNAQGIPYLLIFATLGKHEVVEELLAKGNDVRIRDKFGRTALMLAAMSGQAETLKVILKYDKDLNFKTAKGETALLMAVMENKSESASLLLKAGANPNIRFKGVFLLHIIAEQGKMDFARIMLKYGANPGVKDIKGRTPAQYAKARGHIDLEAMLLGQKEG